MRTDHRVIFSIMVFLLGFSSLQAIASSAPSTAQQDAIKQKLSGMQVPFIANKGQADKTVAFYAPTFAGTMFVTKQGELVYSLPAKTTDKEQKTGSVQVLTERLLGGKATPAPLTDAVTHLNYFIGDDAAKWKSDVSTHSAVGLGEVWEGVDVELHAYGKNVEKIFTVRPGASVDRIRVQLDGADSLKLGQGGALDVATESGTVRFTPPVAWQKKGNEKLPVQVAYVVKDNTYGFKLGAHDASLPVVIDPLLHSTYLGGEGDDSDTSIAIHPSAGYIYVAGTTSSTAFPGTSGGVQSGLRGISDAFVIAYASDFSAIVSATYLGGTGEDSITGIAIHPVSGQVYVTGVTSSTDFPRTLGGAQTVYGGNNSDVFVVRLNISLNRIMQATYLGGSGWEIQPSIAIHPTNSDVYLAGRQLFTVSSDVFPGTTGGAQALLAGGDEFFVSRLSRSLGRIVQSTYLGGTQYEFGPQIAIHPSSGEIYVSGLTDSTDFPGTEGGAQPIKSGAADAVISRLNSELTAILQSTFLGGSSIEGTSGNLYFGPALAIHPVTNDVYIAGETWSLQFPGVTGGAQDLKGALSVAFISRLNTDLTTLLQSTYLGGIGFDAIRAISIHPISGEIYVAGNTTSTDLPSLSGAIQPAYTGNQDGFISRLNRELTSILQTTYLGGSGADVLAAISINSSKGEFYIVGHTESADFPVTAGPAYAGGLNDAYFTAMSDTLTTETQGFILTVASVGTGVGTVTSRDGLIDCGSDCTEGYSLTNTVVTLDAAPASGSTFVGWSGDCSGSLASCTVTMDAARSVNVDFNLTSYTLTIGKRGTGTGTVTSADGLINCGTDCSENYAANTVVTLTATPSVGSTFTGWSVGCAGTETTCLVTMSKSKDARATFNLQAAQ